MTILHDIFGQQICTGHTTPRRGVLCGDAPIVTAVVVEYTERPKPCVACNPVKARNSPIPAEVASMMALQGQSHGSV